MRYVVAQEDVVIPIGRQGETDVVTVQFPTEGWSELYGNGSFELLHKRCKDVAPYPCSITVADGMVNWVIGSADTQYVGRGVAQLVYVVDGAIAKSVIYATSTLRSVDGGSCAPEPWQSWVDEVLAAGAAATEGAEYTNQRALDAEAWAVGQRAGEDVDEDDETFHNNSKYYAERAEQVAVGNGYAYLWIEDDGELYLARTSNILEELDFELTEDGDLEVIFYG